MLTLLPGESVADALDSFADAVDNFADVVDNIADSVGNNFPACINDIIEIGTKEEVGNLSV